MVLIKSAIAALLLFQIIQIEVVNCYAGYENDDLVFVQDGKQQIQAPHIENNEDTFLGRIKRQTGSLFDGWFNWGKKPTTTPAPETTTEAQALSLNAVTTDHHRSTRNSEEEGINESNNVNGNVDKHDDEYMDIGAVAAGRRPENSDDEDLASGSGELEGSAVDDTGHVNRHPPSGERAKFYRITIIALEPYVAEYADPQSQDYLHLSRNLTLALEELLFQQIPNYDHFANVVKISPTDDAFASEVTLDIGSTYTDENEVRDILEQQLRYHALGNVQVSPEDFTFRQFQECNEHTQLKCRDGSCVPLNSRCDGVAQCSDQSDELGCSTTTSTLIPSTDPETEVNEYDPDYDETPSPLDPFFGLYNETQLKGSETGPTSSGNNCRGDDTVRCSDGSRYICSVQKCDGIPDCDDGADEKECGCGPGEFACDVSRCILDRQRCDFIQNCDDGSDERNCNYPACNQHEFRCRNHQCIDSRLRCNGENDCHDKSDELNCPCKDDEFECAVGFCIPKHRRCNGIHDCSNRLDEQNCDENKHCRADEFDCGSGYCINATARCDGRSDCPDRSDERNCTVTTCSSDQFRCIDGSCVGIDKRCNGYNDCRNGEDESQCGSGCGAGEFRCSNGQCISYELQCNGYNDCRDGSDERDCENHIMHYDNKMKKIRGKINIERSKKIKKKKPKGRGAKNKYSNDKTLDLPHSGKSIENPILEAFPELLILQKINGSSPENDWELVNLLLRNSSKFPSNKTNNNFEEFQVNRVNKRYPEDIWKYIENHSGFAPYIPPDNEISENKVQVDESMLKRVLLKLNKTGAVYKYLREHYPQNLTQKFDKIVTKSTISPTTPIPALNYAIFNESNVNNHQEQNLEPKSFDEWLRQLENSRKDDWIAHRKKLKDSILRKRKKTESGADNGKKHEWLNKMPKSRLITTTPSTPVDEKVSTVIFDGLNKSKDSEFGGNRNFDYNLVDDNWLLAETGIEQQDKSITSKSNSVKSDLQIENEIDNSLESLSEVIVLSQSDKSSVESSSTAIFRRIDATTEGAVNIVTETTQFMNFYDKIKDSKIGKYLEKYNLIKKSDKKKVKNQKKSLKTRADHDNKVLRKKKKKANMKNVKVESLRYQNPNNTPSHLPRDVELLNDTFIDNAVDCAFWKTKYDQLYNKTKVNSTEYIDTESLKNPNKSISLSPKSSVSNSDQEFVENSLGKVEEIDEKKSKEKQKKRHKGKKKENEKSKENNKKSERKKSSKNNNGRHKKVKSTTTTPSISLQSPIPGNDSSFSVSEMAISSSTSSPLSSALSSTLENNIPSTSNVSTTLESTKKTTKCTGWSPFCVEDEEEKTSTQTFEVEETTSVLSSEECDPLWGCPVYEENYADSTSESTSTTQNLNTTSEAIVEKRTCPWWDILCSKSSSSSGSANSNSSNPAESPEFSAFESKETYDTSFPNQSSVAGKETIKILEIPKFELTEETMNLSTSTESSFPSLGDYGEEEDQDAHTEDPDDDPCNEDQHFCDGSRCLEEEKVCDRVNDCKDHSDEDNCDYFDGLKTDLSTETTIFLLNTTVKERIKSKCDFLNEFTCNDGSCIPLKYICDSISHCRYSEDETYETCRYYTNEGLAPCPSMDFTCGDGSCIPKKSVCDGIDNCPRAEDELNCERACTPTQFKCSTGGKCIEDIYRCDGHSDCPDNSDEINCRNDGSNNSTHLNPVSPNNTSSWITERPRECDPSFEMRCDNGQCIPLRLRCDNIPDCDDNSDERDCGKCAIDEWRCASGECLPENVRCDGRVQCRDGSDEDVCVNECPTGMFRCNDGICLDERRHCDGHPHCRDGSDEVDCQTPYCPEGQAPCANGVCIQKQFFCDQNVDCHDGSDEKDCPGSTPYPSPSECRHDEYACGDYTCIPKTAVCDGRRDCSGNEDEQDCRGLDDTMDKSTPIIWNPSVSMTNTLDNQIQFGINNHGTTNSYGSRNCTPTDFICADGNCIPSAHRCDNFYDCRDFTDEQYCFGCTRGQFQCGNGDCINGDQKCNRVYDCDDGTDEEGCEFETTTPSSGGRHCPPGQFTCTTDRTCVHYSARCNGIPECRDRSDEEGCEPTGTDGLHLKTYPSDQVIKENPVRQGREVVFQCRDEGHLRAPVRWLRGNGLPLPPGSRDINGRLEMPNIQLDHAGPYICEAVGYPSSTPGQRITVHLEVERFEMPSTRPPQACQYDEATCSNGDCIPKSFVCDNKFDCTDGSDEMRCNPHGCEPNQFRCANKQCVSKIWRCDGDKDCADGSDEENCGTPPPGSVCRSDEYQCHKNNQCIPKSYHCDMERDCIDGSDEIGCSPVYIIKPPPPMVVLVPGETMILTCTAIGVPIPEINWRLNWGHVPEKCSSISVNGTGTLTCPDIGVSDQGAYSCEAINVGGFVFAVPDAILIVKEPRNVCPRGTFNSEAKRPEDCISCFCFGVVDECRSANLFTYQIPPPFDRHRALTVNVDPSAAPTIRGELGSQDAEIRPQGRDGVDIIIPYSDNSVQSLSTKYEIPYFALPEAYLGPRLLSYGGYLRYTVRYSGDGRNNTAPAVILMGNGRTLIHRGRNILPDQEIEESVRFFYGDWYKNEYGREIPASREDIMMTLAHVDNILIKVKYDDSPQLDVSITDITMDSAHETNTGFGSASFVEECSCPTGYTGNSCEECASGFRRRSSGRWLGECYKDEPPCPSGYYGDPSRNIECKLCPCPLTNPANQFTRTCHLGPNRRPICDCPAGYVGERCEKCDDGYVGNPLIPGDMCVPVAQCDPRGSLTPTADADGKCRCKQYSTGLTCDQCKPNTFNPSSRNQFGCISCFCMGITNRCTSSNWYRSEVHVSFTNSIRDFSLIESRNPSAAIITTGIHLDTIRREIVYSDFPNHVNGDVYYWQLPTIFLGNQITSYGGNLKYTVRYVPSPGGQSSRNNAADVELISANDIRLLYFSRESPEPNSPQSFAVPLLEQFWQRTDGTQADREHLLMALADIHAIRIKATYTTHTDAAAISHVSLDTAEKYNTGKERAVEVEECSCPIGYTGLSCEDCAAGYTRAPEGLYLGICEPCNCNGHSGQCDPETGVCENCANHTTGENCDVCEPGYQGDPTREGCTLSGPQPDYCECNPAGSESNQCINGRCECKLNVEGASCNRCRPSTFGLSADNVNGCNQCFCSGVTDQCHESSLYIQEIPAWVYDTHHGFTLTDASRMDVIDDAFDINVPMNEIGYQYTPATRNRRLFWSLPATFTGNKVKSYGGNLTLTQRFTARSGLQPLKDQDVMLLGNGITLFWTNPQELVANNPMTYSVPLRESEWRRLSTEGPRSASRTDLMTVLSNLEAILVRATYSEGMSAAYISDISLNTAVENPTGKSRATQIEACRCPLGYTGTSCESCSRGYYRDITDRSVSVLGACNACPCNDHEESCEMSRSGQVKCHCLPGYTGLFCEEAAELRVGLMPMNAEAPRGTQIDFKCSYNHGSKLYIYFELSSYNGLPLNAWGMESGPLIETDDGAYKIWKVYVGEHPCVIECSIKNRHGIVMAMITTTVTPGDYTATTTPVAPTISPPRISVSIQEDKFQIVHVGSTVRYHCSGRSLDHNQVRIRWEKEGSRLPDRSLDDSQGLLIIRDVKVSDSGVYICRVTDGINIAVEKVTLTVGGSTRSKPQVSIRPAYHQIKEGDPVEFHCEATGNPQPQLTWTRVDRDTRSRHPLINGVWRISSVTKEDEGEYKCVGTNELGSDEKTTILYVLDNPDRHPPPKYPEIGPMITPQEWIGSSGDIIRMICARSNQHASVAWTRSGGLALPISATQKDGVLTISNPGTSDSGIYICIATSYQGTETSTTARITIHPRHTPPNVHVEPEQQTVSQGTVAEVNCIVNDRDPNVEVKWSKYGETSLGPRAQQIGRTLKIINPQVSDRGVYICRANNAGAFFEASAKIEVNPREAPILEVYPPNLQPVILGGSADLQCRVTAGLPIPDVHWMRQDGRPFASNVVQLPGGLLRLVNISLNDGGTYQCSATNEVGSTSAVARIEVQSIPVIRITPSSGGIVRVRLGERVRLTCTADGHPQPNVAWSKYTSGYPGYTSFKSPQATPLSAIYEIVSMSENDEGSYTCQAVNAAGVTDERIQLRIEDDDNGIDDEYPPCRGDQPCPRPTPRPGGSYLPPNNEGIRIPEDYLRIPNGGKVEIRCQVVGPDDTKIYLDWIRIDRSPLPRGSTVHGGILTIPDVTRDAAGEYLCLGLNSSGAELFRAKSHLEIISPPRIELNPNRQTVAPGESPSIVCTATGDQPMRIEWAAIGRDLPPSVRDDRGVLRFHGIAYNDAGKYVCKASNEAGTAEAVAEVLVNAETYNEPTVHAVEREVNTVAGSSVKLRCDTRERATIHWTRDGQALPANARIENNHLELVRVRPEDGGRYICQIQNAQGVSSDYVVLNVAPPAGPVVHIEPSSDIINIGDTFDLRCVFSSRNVATPRYRWYKAEDSLPVTAQVYEDKLRIVSVQMSDSGVYKCRVDTQEGIFEQSYTLIVQGGENDEPAIEMKSVPYGSNIEMGCRVDIEGPIEYKWSKLNGLLPMAMMYENKMKLMKVRAEDAGTYICTASNGVETSEVPTVLVVTGVVPNFSQAPRSYIVLRPLPDSYLKFNIEVSFKSESYDGIIFYNAESSDGSGDFVILSLVNGYPQFKFDLGSGPATIAADQPISLGEWHTIKLIRTRKDCMMLIDDIETPYKAVARGRKQGLDLKEPLYIGNVPDHIALAPSAGTERIGFVGCISSFLISEKPIDLIGDQTDSVGVTTCETCAENPCENSGVCQEAPTKNGYTCLCRAGYTGMQCEFNGQPCYPGVCGKGHCTDTENGFKCQCPQGTYGSRCEQSTDIHQPAFRNSRSYLAYPTPNRTLKRLRLSMNFNPSDNGDSVLVYCSETDEGPGDFAAVIIKNRHIEFRFDVGSGMTVVKSNFIIQPGVWTKLTINRESKFGKLSVNDEPFIEGHAPGAAKRMSLNTLLYVGGVNRSRVTINKRVEVTRHFHGCINELEISGMNLNLLDSAVDLANIEDCEIPSIPRNRNSSTGIPIFHHEIQSTSLISPSITEAYDPCEEKPCRHGVCQMSSNTYGYSCTCEYGYVGINCENVLKQCEMLRPCRNNGICLDLRGAYKCDCPLGFSGKDCEKQVEILYDVAFRGDGWLELDRSVMTHHEDRELIGFEISTNKTEGLIMWHGQTPNDLNPDDYIALAVVDGYIEYQYNLGSGPAVIRVTTQRVDDGERHRIILKRQGSDGSIELNGEHTENGVSDGLQQILNARGSVYLGGVPDYEMTYGRYHTGFTGCIYTMEVQDSGAIDIGDKAIRGKNVFPCTRWNPSSLVFTDADTDGFDAFVPPPPVNIIHPKPTVNLSSWNKRNLYVLTIVYNIIQLTSSVIIDAKVCPNIFESLIILGLLNCVKNWLIY